MSRVIEGVGCGGIDGNGSRLCGWIWFLALLQSVKLNASVRTGTYQREAVASRSAVLSLPQPCWEMLYFHCGVLMSTVKKEKTSLIEM